MKVLHVIPSIGPLHGGPSVVVRTMSEGLAARGCQVDVAATDDNAGGRMKVPLEVPVRENGVDYWYFRRQLRFYTISMPLSRWLEDHIANYDVVHIHALFSFSSLSAAYWATQSRVPYIVRPLGVLNRWGRENRRPWLKRASLRFLDGPLLARAAAVHYTSNEEREEAAEVAGAVHPVIIPNPVDLRFDAQRRASASGWLRSRYPELACKRIILFLSRIHPKKGIDLLLVAFAQLRRQIPELALVIGGNGDEEFTAELQSQAGKFGIADHVFWPGFLDGEPKQSALAEADLYVLPSYSENFGVAVVEALAAGLPVIVSDQVAIHTEIAASSAGLVVPCKADDLTRAMASVLTNEDLREKLARNGTILAKRYSIETVTGQLVNLYEEIVNGAAR